MTAAELAHALGGYLSGTKRAKPDLVALASAHAALPRREPTQRIGRPPWAPATGAVTLRQRLLAALDTHEVDELLLYGSQARGTTTGFSDVDAALVVPDAVVEDPRRLSALRARVLAAGRAVLAHQPMQHHGFDVVTPTLLAQGDVLPLPEVAWSEAASLFGRGAPATFASVATDERRRRFAELAGGVLATKAWPHHPWQAHRIVSMFELVPTLFVQAGGLDVPKWESFDAAQDELHLDDWAYDDLKVVRERWPRRRRPLLEVASAAARNPWSAVAAWRRLPSRLPGPVEPLLTSSLLGRLHEHVRAMEAHLR